MTTMMMRMTMSTTMRMMMMMMTMRTTIAIMMMKAVAVVVAVVHLITVLKRRLPGSKEVQIIGLLTKARELLAASGNGNEDREEDQKLQQPPDGAPGGDSVSQLPRVSPEDMNEQELNDAFIQMRRDSLESLLSNSPSMRCGR